MAERGRVARSLLRSLLIALLACASEPLFAYDASVHQSLTFLAAKQLQRCLPPEAQPFTALEVRAIAASAADEVGGGALGRPFRWQYHDPIEREEGWLDLAVSTRLNGAFAADLERLARRPVRERGLRVLGRGGWPHPAGDRAGAGVAGLRPAILARQSFRPVRAVPGA